VSRGVGVRGARAGPVVVRRGHLHPPRSWCARSGTAREAVPNAPTTTRGVVPRERSGRVEAVKAVIMAGGEGTRLRPLTSNQPKPMLPMVNRPMMEHIVGLLREHGFADIVV